jgi:hypothetical protein
LPTVQQRRQRQHWGAQTSSAEPDMPPANPGVTAYHSSPAVQSSRQHRHKEPAAAAAAAEA